MEKAPLEAVTFAIQFDNRQAAAAAAAAATAPPVRMVMWGKEFRYTMENWPGGRGAGPPHEPREGDPHETTHVIPQFQRAQPFHVNQPPWPQATAGGDPPGWPPGGPADRPAPSRTTASRTRRLALLPAAAVAVAAISVGIAYTRTDTGGGGGSAGAATASETVVAYLDALSSGDAATALSYGKSQPANSSLLTAEVLRTQIAAMPISEIQVVQEREGESGPGSADVELTMNFGGVSSDATMGLTKVGEEWKVDHAFNELHIADHTAAVATLRILGKKLTQRETLYIFPGSLELVTSNEYIDATFTSPLPGQTPVVFRPKVDLSDQGEAAVLDAVANAYAQCEGSRMLAPPGCPAKIADPDVVEGAITWGKADVGGVAVTDFNDQRMFATVDGEVRIPVSGQLRSGEPFARTAVHHLNETVDLKTSPPEIIG